MIRARSTLLAAAITALLMLPPLSQSVLAPSDEARFVIYAQETLPQHAAFDVHVRAKRFLLHCELGRLIGTTALASVFDPDPLQLPRREKETLACLLEGDSEKQVATRLGVSSPTNHFQV